MKDTIKEEIENGFGETVHPKGIKREAENGIKTENGEPAAKIKKESKYNLFHSWTIEFFVSCQPCFKYIIAKLIESD